MILAFCRYTDPITTEQIMGALIKQLIERHPSSVLPFVMPLYGQHLREKTHPSQSDLLAMLQQISSSGVFNKMFCAVDGLDEASTSLQGKILDSLASLRINFFITSRRLDSLKDLVPTATFFDIIVRDGDILILIEEKIRLLPTLTRMLADDKLKLEVVSKILDKSSGM